MIVTLADLDWPRRTERLTLRPVVDADARAIHDYLRLPEVHRWLTSIPAPWESFPDEFEQRRRRWLAIEYDGRVVGNLKIDQQDAWAQAEVADQARRLQAELGWTLHPEAQGQGIATEAATEALAICFDGLGLRRVVAECFADNTASWHVMEKIGLRREAHYVRESLHRDGNWHDGMTYALLADEWRSRVRHRPCDAAVS
ncbi:GNAT family protein [Brooklawnia cerclae]|uniref:RimJ/RimL family protein N-acetyltransferase n=1 Tax=Brooklawnia cerclae TaxID=349934 RepID=A0ABX0SGB3_9ACTN|nr:RimJ/RimL family protein N-acetyltransferase [Brooklawnia cerclae]